MFRSRSSSFTFLVLSATVLVSVLSQSNELPEKIRDSLVKGGHEVSEAVDYAVDRTVSVLEGSKSGASADEASSGLDSIVAQAMTTREDGMKRIHSEMESLQKGLKDSQDQNTYQNEKLSSVDDMLNSIRKDLKAEPLSSEEKAYAEELSDHVKKFMSRQGEFGSTEEKLGDELENMRKNAENALKERQNQNERLRGHDKELETIERKIEKLRPDLREISLRRSGEGLTFDERSGDETVPELSPSDLIERGRPFLNEAAFLEVTEREVEEEDLSDGDEFKIDLTSFNRPLLDPSFFDDLESPDLNFETGATGLATGSTGSATGLEEMEEEDEASGPEDSQDKDEEDEEEEEDETMQTQKKPDPSATEKARIWEFLTGRRYREAVAIAATDAVSTHDAAVKFKAQANVLRTNAINTRKKCQVLDHETDAQTVLTSDAKIYSKAEGENLEQIDGRYTKFVSIVGKDTNSLRHKTTLAVLAQARDEAIASSKDAERQFEEANERLQDLKKSQSSCWAKARVLAQMSRESHHHMLQLDLVAAEALYMYSETLKSFYEDEVAADQTHVLNIAREAAMLLGSEYINFEDLEEDTMMTTGSTGGEGDRLSSSLEDLNSLQDVPAPVGRWVPAPDSTLPLNLPEPSFSTGSASDSAADHIATHAVKILRWESTRDSKLKRDVFVKSSEVQAAAAARLEKAEEIAKTGDEPSAEQTRELAELVLEENRKVTEYHLAEVAVSKEEKVVKSLRSLVEQKLGLLESRDRVVRAEKSENDAFEKIEHERAMSAKAVTRAVTPDTQDENLPPIPELLPSEKPSEEEVDDEDEFAEPPVVSEKSPKQLADVGDLLKASVAETVGYPALLEERERYDQYKAYVQQTHRINEKSLHDGTLGGNMYVPDLNEVDPKSAMDVAQHVASVASARSKHSSLAATEAAKTANLAKRQAERMDYTKKLGADAFTIADMKAKIAEASVGIPNGGATGLAWQGLNFPGSPPEIWYRGDPRDRRTSHLISDVKEMGPLSDFEDDDGVTGNDDENPDLTDSVHDEFGVFGPTGPKADLLMDSIREIRHHFEVLSVRAKQYRAEADRLRKHRQVTQNDAKASRWENEVASSAMKQVHASHDRNVWWADSTERTAEDAERWFAENQEAKEERKLQHAMNQEGKLLDEENQALGSSSINSNSLRGGG